MEKIGETFKQEKQRNVFAFKWNNKKKKGKEKKKGKNEKEKNHETTQQHNAVVLNDIYEKK